MSVATVLIQDVEVGAEKVLGWLGAEGKVVAKATAAEPQVVAALAVVMSGVGKAVSDVAVGAANPASLVVNLGADIADLKSVWPDVTAFLATLGIKL